MSGRSDESVCSGVADGAASGFADGGEIVFVTPVAESELPAAVRAECNPVAGMGPVEVAVLSALRLWPRGATAAALADAVGVQRSAATQALERSLETGLVARSEETPPMYRSHRSAVFWRLADAARTASLMPYLPLPVRTPRRGFEDCGVPGRFWHLFWSGVDPSCLRLPRDAALVGRRLMESFDSEARSWVLSRFTAEQLEDCLDAYSDPGSEVPTLIRRTLHSLR